MSTPEVLAATGDDELAALAAELVARAVLDAVERRGVARIALSGGSTPAPAYRALAAQGLPWARVQVYLVDERAVPLDHDRSNGKMIAGALAAAVQAGAQLVHMDASREDRHAAALEYDRALRKSFGVTSAVALDAIVLGIGDDGHTASLFPGQGSTAIDDRLVAAVDATGGLEPRLTLTAPMIRASRLAVVLAKGAAKRLPIQNALAPGSLEEIPARVISSIEGRVVWIVDEAARP